LCIGPGAFAHLDLANVGEQALGAPAQQVLLNLDESEKSCEQRKGGKRGGAENPYPTSTGGHIRLDTSEERFVPGNSTPPVLPAICTGRFFACHFRLTMPL
jgi:hypothetical protein